MIVPEMWAEAKVKGGIDGHAVTVRRFGWSNESEAAALQMAEARAQEAFDRMASGERLPKREPKVPYNGADGVPIREEVIRRDGETVITRNSYGALCLNTPDVLFADIDFADEFPAPVTCLGSLALMLFATGTAYTLAGRSAAVATAPISLFLAPPAVAWIGQLLRRMGRSAEARAIKRVEALATRLSGALFDVYRTPAGLRVLARHTTYDAAGEETRELFQFLRTDRIYRRMCMKQRCFRARLSPKPWRIGIEAHMKPRPGAWPINPVRLPERERWVEDYDRAGAGHAACRFLTTIGDGTEDARVRRVRELHDSLSRAREDLPIA